MSRRRQSKRELDSTSVSLKLSEGKTVFPGPRSRSRSNSRSRSRSRSIPRIPKTYQLRSRKGNSSGQRKVTVNSTTEHGLHKPIVELTNPKKTKRRYRQNRKNILATALAERVQQPLLNATEMQDPVDFDAFMTLCGVIIETYAKETNMFLCTGAPSPNPPYKLAPGELGCYFHVCLMMYIRKNGLLTGSNVGLIPTNDDLAIPVVFGKWLAGLGVYSENGSFCKTTYAVPTTLPTPTYSYPGANYSMRGFNALWSVSLIYSGGLSELGEFKYVADAPSTSYPSPTAFLTNALAKISQMLATCKCIEWMKLKDVPGTAPNGSAYTSISKPVWQALNYSAPPAGFPVYRSAFRRVNSEEAGLYTITPDSIFFVNNWSYPYSSPSAYCNFQSSMNGTADYSYIYYTFVHCWKYTKYQHGDIMSTTKFCGVKLATLVPMPKPFQFDVVLDLASAVWAQLAANTNVSTQFSDTKGQIWRLLITMVSNLVLARMTYYCPFNILDSARSSQALYVTKNWFSLTYPPLVAQFLADFGPVVSNNILCFPCNGFSYGSIGQTTPWSWLNSVSGPSGPFGNSNYNCPVFDNSYLVNSQNINNLVSQIQAGNTLPLASASCNTLYKQLVHFCSTLSIGADNINSLNVHLHLKQCGSLSLQSTVVQFYNPQPGTLQPILETTQYPNVPFISFTPRSVCCLNAHINLEVTEATLITAYGCYIRASAGDLPSDNPNSKFAIELSSMQSTTDLMQDIMEITYVIGGTIHKAIGDQEANFNPGSINDGSVLNIMVMPKNKADCFWAALFIAAVRTITPFAVSAATALAEEAGRRIAAWVASRAGSVGHDVPMPTTAGGRSSASVGSNSDQIIVSGNTESLALQTDNQSQLARTSQVIKVQ